MNAGFERVVRDAINDLADEGRAVNLSAAAVRQGRRIVVRRRIISAAAAVAAAAALAVPFVLVNDRPQTLQPGSAPVPAHTTEPPPTPSPTAGATSTSVAPPGATRQVGPIGKSALKVGGGLVILAAPATKGTWVLDRARQVYRVIPYERAYPAPVGENVAVTEAGRVGLYNMRSGTVRWVNGQQNVVGTFDWSEDGSRLLYPVNGNAPNTLRLGVFDVNAFRLKVLGKDIECYENCAPAWLPGSKEVTLTDASTGVVRAYSSVDGTPSGTLKLPGSIPALHSWSPDGTLVAARSANQTVIVDNSNGAQVLSLNERADCVYWINDSSLVVVSADGFTTYNLSGDAREFVATPSGITEGELPATILGLP